MSNLRYNTCSINKPMHFDRLNQEVNIGDYGVCIITPWGISGTPQLFRCKILYATQHFFRVAILEADSNEELQRTTRGLTYKPYRNKYIGKHKFVKIEQTETTSSK